ncbi:MAG: hypothetical protein AAGA27_02530 [Pseudomonadota bacterium]
MLPKLKTILYIVIGVILLFNLSACANTTSTVDQTTKNHYKVTTLSKKNGESIRAAMNTAFDYCKKQGLCATVTHTISNYQAVGMPKKFQYMTTLYFNCHTCLSETDKY